MAFPSSPLDVRTELYLDGAWVDISEDVRVASGLVIHRGQADEGSRSDPGKCSLVIDNSEGKYSPRNPASPYYGLLGRNTRIRVAVAGETRALYLDGTNVLAATTPDTSALDIAGDLDIRVLVALDRWSSDNAQTFIGKDEFAYSFGKDENDLLRFEWTSDSLFRAARSSVPVTFENGTAHWVRVVYDKDSGGGQHTTTFYTSEDGTTWDQLGTSVTGAGTGSIAANSTPLALGNRGDLVSPMAGRIYKVEVRDGATLVASPDFTAQTEGTTSFTDSAGRTWTITDPYEVTTKDYRFYGEVSSWPARWDVSGADVTVPVEAAGILRRLGQGATVLKSTLYRGLTSPGLTDTPVAYWPCEDAEGSLSLASATPGGSPMRINGSPHLQESEAFACSEPIPVLNDSEWTGTVPTYTSTGQIQARFLLAVPAGGDTTGQTIFRLRTSGTANRWELDYSSSGGNLALRAYSGESSQVLDSGFFAFGANGKLLRMSIELVQNGTSINWAFSSLEVGGDGATVSGTLSSHTIGTVSKVVVNPTGGLLTTAVGHISIQTAVTSLFDLGGQVNAWENEEAGERIRRLCEEEGVPLTIIGDRLDTTKMGAQRPAKLLDLLTEAAETDLGILTEPRNAFGLLYRTRKSLYNQDTRVSLDYEGHHLVPPFEPVDDDQGTRNDITVKRTDGSSARAVLETGPLSVADPPDGVGRYSEDVTLGVRRDAQLPDHAGFRLRLGTVDEARYPAIAVDLAAPAVAANPTLTTTLIRADVGDRLTVDNLPSWLPPGQVSQIIRGMTERLGEFDWDVEFTCSPESPWRVGVYGTARYGTAGSALASSVNTTATSLSVTTSKGPIWTTASGHFPFIIRVGAEEMTVTAISGTGSTQTFTVNRSTNAVVQSHPAGAAVTLADRAYRAL